MVENNPKLCPLPKHRTSQGLMFQTYKKGHCFLPPVEGREESVLWIPIHSPTHYEKSDPRLQTWETGHVLLFCDSCSSQPCLFCLEENCSSLRPSSPGPGLGIPPYTFLAPAPGIRLLSGQNEVEPGPTMPVRVKRRTLPVWEFCSCFWWPGCRNF